MHGTNAPLRWSKIHFGDYPAQEAGLAGPRSPGWKGS